MSTHRNAHKRRRDAAYRTGFQAGQRAGLQLKPVAWRWRTEVFRDWTVTDIEPGDQATMEAATSLNMSGLEIQPLFACAESPG